MSSTTSFLSSTSSSGVTGSSSATDTTPSLRPVKSIKKTKRCTMSSCRWDEAAHHLLTKEDIVLEEEEEEEEDEHLADLELEQVQMQVLALKQEQSQLVGYIQSLRTDVSGMLDRVMVLSTARKDALSENELLRSKMDDLLSASARVSSGKRASPPDVLMPSSSATEAATSVATAAMLAC